MTSAVQYFCPPEYDDARNELPAVAVKREPLSAPHEGLALGGAQDLDNIQQYLRFAKWPFALIPTPL